MVALTTSEDIWLSVVFIAVTPAPISNWSTVQAQKYCHGTWRPSPVSSRREEHVTGEDGAFSPIYHYRMPAPLSCFQVLGVEEITIDPLSPSPREARVKGDDAAHWLHDEGCGRAR